MLGETTDFYKWSNFPCLNIWFLFSDFSLIFFSSSHSPVEIFAHTMGHYILFFYLLSVLESRHFFQFFNWLKKKSNQKNPNNCQICTKLYSSHLKRKIFVEWQTVWVFFFLYSFCFSIQIFIFIRHMCRSSYLQFDRCWPTNF